MNYDESINFTDEEIYQKLGEIFTKFKLLECDKCAAAVIKWLKQCGIHGIYCDYKQ